MKPETKTEKDNAAVVVAGMSDEELFAAIREQVNMARNQTGGHNRAMTRAIGDEIVKRGWCN